jgi:hypothetical protein
VLALLHDVFDRVHGARSDHANVDSSAIQLHAILAQPRNIEQVVDHARHLDDLAVYQQSSFFVRHVLDRTSFQDMHGAPDDSEEIAQLVGELSKHILGLGFIHSATDVDRPIATLGVAPVQVGSFGLGSH